jgi:hypothetical protein
MEELAATKNRISFRVERAGGIVASFSGPVIREIVFLCQHFVVSPLRLCVAFL